jgi:hypothetical protein
VAKRTQRTSLASFFAALLPRNALIAINFRIVGNPEVMTRPALSSGLPVIHSMVLYSH